MIDPNEHGDTVDEAVSLATRFLKTCEKESVDINVAQAAFGNGWFRLCLAMGFTFQEMREILQEWLQMYHERLGEE
jgi:predicted RNase H-like HicB family nuclease